MVKGSPFFPEAVSPAFAGLPFRSTLLLSYFFPPLK
jgi:hypothetical protein